MQKFHTDFSFQQPIQHAVKKQPEKKLTVLGDFSITSYHCIKYLSERKIPVSAAEHFCREVRFSVNNKTYFAIGFKNDAGGYELRNAFLKLSSSPKDVTTIKNGSDTLCVFEGFFDFLSYYMLYGAASIRQADFLILNTTAFFEKSLLFMEGYKIVKLFLDRDTTGQNCSRMAMERSTVYYDESLLYKDYNDLNEWLVKNAE